MADKKQVGAGWKKETDKGTYVSLSFKAEEIADLDLSNCWVSLVKNNKKQKPTHPDYNILASPKEGAPQKKPQKQEEDDFGF